MITIIFLIVLIASIKIINNKNGAGVNDEILSFDMKGNMIILICFASSFILNIIVNKFFNKYYFPVIIFSAGAYSMILTIVNIWREESIKKKHDQILNIYQALTDIFGKVVVDEVDYDNMPFKYETDKKTNNVNKIIIDTSQDGKFNDNSITYALYNINKFFPECQWTSDMDHPNRTLTFIGLPKPPNIAKWMGSDYRPTGWIPLGLSGQGEIGWNIANPSKSEIGISSYIDEEGHIPDYVDMPSAPQCLTLGSPLSLDTIIPTINGYKTMKTISINDYVFDVYNNPCKVLGLSPIKLSNKMFEMTLEYNNIKIIIKSDEIHKFPLIYDNNYNLRDIKPMNWIYNNYEHHNFTIVGLDENGNNCNYNILNIRIIPNELVRCILVDSDSHLFLITDKIKNEWNNGKKFNFEGIMTSNTGGGKSVWIGQKIEILNDK